MTDLVVPGVGPVALALVNILQLCVEMKEAQDTCRRLHGRLHDIMNELVIMQERKQLPQTQALDKYVAVVKRYHEYLLQYRGKSLVSRLTKHRKMMDELLAIQQDVVMLFGMLQLATTASVMEWRKQWENDRQVQEEIMAVTVSNDAEVLRELQSLRTQVEAVMTLKFEVEQRASRQSDTMLELMKRLASTVVRASKARVQALPLWFMPSGEITFEPREFARGSYGSVHRGVWGSGTNVVVKCLLIDDAQLDERAQQRIEAEIGIWHRLNHPNVIKMFGACHVSIPPFIVCEDATNGNLCAFLARSDDNKRQTWRLLYQAALGLEYVHKNSIVHGDLKLNNILVGADGLAKLADFGLSTVRTCSTLSKERTDTPKVSGGLRWRAPECLRRRPTFASDVYSFAMCIIEAFEGEPPYGFLDDDSVRDALRSGEIPEQPEAMDDSEWELIESMTVKEPKERLSLARVLNRLKVFAETEKAAESKRISHTEPENEESTATKLSLTSCDICAASVQSSSVFCSHCGARMAKSTLSTALKNEICIDNSSSVEELMSAISSGSAEEKERALLLLTRKCINKQERKWLHSPESIHVLSEVVRTVPTYFSQLYALESVAWAVEDKARLGKSDLSALVEMVRDPSPEELGALALKLKSGTAQEKADALVLCGCFGTLATCGDRTPMDDSILVRLVETLASGSDMQKFWAAYALGNLASNDTNRATIVRTGGIPPLLTLLRNGNKEQKRRAAYAFGTLAFESDDNRDTIARKSGVPALVAFVEFGTDKQKQWSAYALGHLACDNDSSATIAREGGIPPLVTLARSGTAKQKRNAAYALEMLASNDATRVAMTREGVISPLVILVRSGTDEQKENAAYALGSLACNDGMIKDKIHRAGVFDALHELCAFGSRKVRAAAKYALDELERM